MYVCMYVCVIPILRWWHATSQAQVKRIQDAARDRPTVVTLDGTFCDGSIYVCSSISDLRANLSMIPSAAPIPTRTMGTYFQYRSVLREADQLRYNLLIRAK